jgi:hypothetical protein
VIDDARQAFERAELLAARKERKELIEAGKEIPDHLVPLRQQRLTMEREQREREAAKETTPASKADLGRLEQVVTGLKSKIHALGDKP